MITINVQKKYGERLVLDIQDLTFKRGVNYALVGANGSGKSTLLKIIDNQIKADGTIEKEKLIVSYMPQKSYAFNLSVINNILLPVKAQDRKSMYEKATELIASLGLSHLTKKNASHLSGGETQRMALARTLMLPSDLLLLDEPTAAMDIGSSIIARDVINKYKNTQSSLILATHSINEAIALADYILYMENGRIIELVPSKDFFQSINDSRTKAYIEQYNINN